MNVSLALGRGRVPTPPRPSPAPGDLLRPVDVVWFCLVWFDLVWFGFFWRFVTCLVLVRLLWLVTATLETFTATNQRPY